MFDNFKSGIVYKAFRQKKPTETEPIGSESINGQITHCNWRIFFCIIAIGAFFFCTLSKIILKHLWFQGKIEFYCRCFFYQPIRFASDTFCRQWHLLSPICFVASDIFYLRYVLSPICSCQYLSYLSAVMLSARLGSTRPYCVWPRSKCPRCVCPRCVCPRCVCTL